MSPLSVNVQRSNGRAVSLVDHFISRFQFAETLPAAVDRPQISGFVVPRHDETAGIQTDQDRFTGFQRKIFETILMRRGRCLGVLCFNHAWMIYGSDDKSGQNRCKKIRPC